MFFLSCLSDGFTTGLLNCALPTIPSSEHDQAGADGVSVIDYYTTSDQPRPIRFVIEDCLAASNSFQTVLSVSNRDSSGLSVEVSDVRFTNNNAAAINVVSVPSARIGSSLQVRDCTFRRSVAPFLVFSDLDDISVTQSNFDENLMISDENSAAGFASTVLAFSRRLSVRDCIFSHTRGDAAGSAIGALNVDDVDISHSRFEENGTSNLCITC